MTKRHAPRIDRPTSGQPLQRHSAPWYEGNLFSGVDFFAWMRVLIRNRFALSPSRCPAAISVTLMSLVNTSLRFVQDVIFGPRIRAVRIDESPVFIVGFWRTGTTLLHELLALDPKNRSPNTYESLSPNHFLLTEDYIPRWLTFMLPSNRPMDNMAVGWERPQEDEVALCNLGAGSSFWTVAFPNHAPQDPEYVDQRELSPEQRRQWRATYEKFLQMVLLKRPGRLVLKSPQHSYRIGTLRQIFPKARFVQTVRDPYVVFPSTVHFWRKMYERHAFQQPTLADLEDRVFGAFERMDAQLEEGLSDVEPERKLVVRYERLVDDPVRQVGRIYSQFGWDSFHDARPRIRAYGAEKADYRTNRYTISDALRSKIATRWANYIDRFGYQKLVGESCSDIHSAT